MYQADEQDRVIRLEGVPQCDVGAPAPVVLSDEFTVLLAYSEVADESLVLVEFEGCRSYMFGGPNDEAFAGHPLAARGLQPYGAFRIENSSWVRQLEQMNSVHPRHDPQKFAELHHFVFAFHDSTFECVARRFTTSTHEGTLAGLLPAMLNRLKTVSCI